MESIIKDIPYAEISSKLQACFGNLDSLARETKFVQRNSPFSGLIFVHVLLIGFLKNPQASLNELAQRSLELGVAISPQGIHARINDYAVAFLRQIYLQALTRLQNTACLPMAMLQQFTAIWIIDSTFKSLPESMEADYPGSGGKSSSASLKVQLVYEFLRGNLSQVTLQAGRCADQAYHAYLDQVQAGSLVLMDLGYFCLKSLCSIALAGAYFIIRYPYPTALYSLAGERLDLLALLQAHGLQDLDLEVRIGANSQRSLQGRLIARPVPLAVAEERRRKAKRSGATHGKTRSEYHLALLGWSIFITNVPSTWLATSQVLTLYRVRWQIEMMFKFWKSYCGFAAIPASRSPRVMTELYTKLLIALWSLFLVAPVRSLGDREVSLVQLRKILAEHARSLLANLARRDSLFSPLQTFYQRVAQFGLKQRRRSRPNVLALFDDEPVLMPTP